MDLSNELRGTHDAPAHRGVGRPTRPSRQFLPRTDEDADADRRAGGAAVLRRSDLVVAAVLAAVVFAGNYAFERTLDRFQVLNEYDVMFNADPVSRLRAIGQGFGDPMDASIHPAFGVYFSNPIRWAAGAAKSTGLLARAGTNTRDFRRALALLVVPSLSALSMSGAFALFLFNGLPRPRALLMAVLCSLSFSQVVFGSLPDHFAVTGFLLTAMALLASDMVRHGGKVRWAFWVLAGGVATGVTITNVVPFVVFFATSRKLSGASFGRVVRDVAVVSVASLALTGAFMSAAKTPPKHPGWSADYVGKHTRGYLKSEADRVPRAILDTFAPVGLWTAELSGWIAGANRSGTGRSDRMFMTEASAYPGLVAFACALAACGAVACLRRGGPFRAVAVGCLGVMAFYLTLHSFWGDQGNLFLYTQHWLVPLAVVLSGNLTWPGRVGRSFSCLYAVLAVALVVNDYALLGRIVSTLQAATV